MSAAPCPRCPRRGARELIDHFRRVRLLESDLAGSGENRCLTVGVNADSLATWFPEAADPFLEAGGLLDLRIDDQEETREMLKNGEVVGCIGSDETPLQGCGRKFLGTMSYALACTEDFRARCFPSGLTTEALGGAPAVLFNRKDRIHTRFLELVFPSFRGDFPVHYVPSPEQFLAFVARGRAYGAVPLMQARPLLGGSLTELAGARYEVPLWWHHWNLHTPALETLTACLTERGRSLIY